MWVFSSFVFKAAVAAAAAKTLEAVLDLAAKSFKLCCEQKNYLSLLVFVTENTSIKLALI